MTFLISFAVYLVAFAAGAALTWVAVRLALPAAEPEREDVR